MVKTWDEAAFSPSTAYLLLVIGSFDMNETDMGPIIIGKGIMIPVDGMGGDLDVAYIRGRAGFDNNRRMVKIISFIKGELNNVPGPDIFYIYFLGDRAFGAIIDKKPV